MKKLKKIDGFCAPFALKYLSGYADSTVYDACSANWFMQKYGMEEHEFLDAAKHLGIRMRRINLKKLEIYRIKLKKFIKKYPDGKYLIYTSAHIFVVDSGRVVDTINGRYKGLDRMVTGAWKVYC